LDQNPALVTEGFIGKTVPDRLYMDVPQATGWAKRRHYVFKIQRFPFFFQPHAMK